MISILVRIFILLIILSLLGKFIKVAFPTLCKILLVCILFYYLGKCTGIVCGILMIIRGFLRIV